MDVEQFSKVLLFLTRVHVLKAAVNNEQTKSYISIHGWFWSTNFLLFSG